MVTEGKAIIPKMIIRDQLLKEHSKNNTNLIVDYIGSDANKMAALMKCFFHNEYRVTQRAAMAVSAIFDKQPELIQEYLGLLIDNLEDTKLHVAIKRNTVRILQFVQIPENQLSKLFDICCGFIISKKEPIAVKAFSMTIVYNVCKLYPELKVEILPTIEDLIENSESAGIQNRGRKIASLLRQL